MGRKTFVSLLILIFLLLPSQFLMLKNSMYPSHDGLYHIARISEFHQSLTSGQFPPRLAPSLIGNIGYPLFIVNYQLPYYLAEIYMTFDPNPTIAFKVVMSITYILGAIFAFFLFKNFGSNIASLTGAVLFAYLPYRFANLYARGSFGESVALVFIPLTLLSFHLLLQQKKYALPFISLAIFGLITSHTLIFFLFIPLFISYIFIFIKPNKQLLIQLILGVVLGIFLASFQLLPAVFEKKYLKFDQNLTDLYKGHFIKITQLLRIPQTGVNIGTPFQIGIVSTIVIILSLISTIIKPNFYCTFFLIFIASSIFASLHLSSLFWKYSPYFIKYILYPWRFLSIIILSVAFLSVYLTDLVKYKKIFAFILIFFAIYTSRHYFLKSTQLESNLPTTTLTTQNEFEPIWTNGNTYKPRPTITYFPSGKVSNLKENNSSLTFNIQTESWTTIVLRKLYFPGWKLKINSKNYELGEKDGLISFNLLPGTYQTETYFTETPLRKTADLISLLSFIFLLGLFYFSARKPSQ